MKRIRIVGLCLVAVFALSAVAASGASAGTLLLKATNGNIAGGEFLSKGGLSKLVTTGGKVIECSSVINHGKLHNSTLGLVLILFQGCKETEFNSKCNSSGAGTGEIHIPLSTIFHVGLAHNTSGTNTTIPAVIILLPAGGINFTCFGGLVKVKVTGNVIGELRNGGAQAALNTEYESLELVFQQAAGVQALKLILLEGETLTNQNLTSEIGGAKEEAGQESTDTLDGFKNGLGEPTNVKLEEP